MGLIDILLGRGSKRRNNNEGLNNEGMSLETAQAIVYGTEVGDRAKAEGIVRAHYDASLRRGPETRFDGSEDDGVAPSDIEGGD